MPAAPGKAAAGPPVHDGDYSGDTGSRAGLSLIELQNTFRLTTLSLQISQHLTVVTAHAEYWCQARSCLLGRDQ